MKTFLTIVAMAGGIALAGTAAERWVGGGLAVAQTPGSSACYQNCRNVRDWASPAQCRDFCKGRAKKKTK
jgi:hypothetical protein